MKGLILKDLFVLKDVLKIYVVIFLFYGWMALADGQTGLLMAIVFVCSTVRPVNALAYDERSHWDRVANTMPVSRRRIVLAKYLLSLLLAEASSVMAGLVMVVGRIVPLVEIVASIVVMLAMGAVYQAVLIPIIYKFGSEKSRIIMVAAMMIPWLLFTALAKTGMVDFSVLTAFMDANTAVMPFIIVAVVAVVYTLSALLSINIYSKKEL